LYQKGWSGMAAPYLSSYLNTLFNFFLSLSCPSTAGTDLTVLTAESHSRLLL